jgi:chromosome segregation ATPase
LRTSKQGLPEALAGQSKTMADTAKAVEGMSGDEFVRHLADGDPKLADLGITQDQAKAIKQLSGTPEGKKIPEQLRQDSLKALQDAPVEAGKKVDQFLTNVDDAIAKVDKAASEGQLKAAVDDANAHLGPEEQAKQAVTDEQSFVKKRLEGARRSGVREQAQKRLEDLQPQKTKTQAEITKLERELSDAQSKVNRLKKQALDSPQGSPERAKALEEFRAAKEELKNLTDEDALGGYKEERARQNKLEEDILASLELKRPSLWQSTKDAIKKAAKKNKDGKFLDANTGEVIEGEPVYGHKYGRENRRLILEASEKGMTQEQFTQWVNDHPEWFQTETKANNESHRFEKPGVD